MVERGHFDGVAPDETVAYEFAKVRHLYAAKLGLGARTEIEWFVGPHTINGVGTFAFLHKHLKWPKPESPLPRANVRRVRVVVGMRSTSGPAEEAALSPR